MAGKVTGRKRRSSSRGRRKSVDQDVEEESPTKRQATEEALADKENEENAVLSSKSRSSTGKRRGALQANKRAKETANAEHPSDNEEGGEEPVTEEAEVPADVISSGNDLASDVGGIGESKSADKESEVEDSKAHVIQSPRSILGHKERSKDSEAGIIKEICVENFMCHRKLSVKLNRNVNFIHGQNGSGKSAILAAIQICLGANARRTHRARNLKDLVRKDSANTPSHAKVRVTLLNNENDGYKYDIYGDTVTVERTIAMKGGYNGYKLLDHNMKEQSRSKKDLDDMLDTLNIQVENPVAVLDQEEAKKFLMGKSEDKYNFFMKATELERVDRTHAATIDQLHELTEANDRVKEGLRQKMDHVDALKKKYEEHLEVEKLEKKAMDLTTKYAWSYFGELNKQYTNTVDSMNEFKEKAAKKEEELSQAEESADNPSNEEKEKRERMDELLAEVQKQTSLKRDLEDKLHQAQVPYKNAERQLQAVKKEQKRAEKQLKAARQRLQEARDEMVARAGSAESEEAQRTAMLKKAEEELAAAREKVSQLKQNVTSALRSWEELEPNVQHAKGRVRALSNQLRGVESTITELESSSGNSLAIWGRNVTKVAQMVEKAKRSRKFQGDVVGPIGAYLKIAPGKEDFASIAELAIGHGTLDRFIVTNDHDRCLFQEIRKQAGCTKDCGVFQLRPSSRFNVPPPPDVEGIETVASILKIDNDIVFNCLVDNARIDQNAVARDKRLSEDSLLIKNGQDYSMRGNIKTVFCLPRGDQWTVKNGSLALFSNEKKLQATIGVDRSAAIESAKREEETLREELKELKNEDAKLEHQHSVSQREWNKAKKAMQQNDNRITELTTEIEGIKSEMETSATFTIDTTEYEEDVQQAEETLEKLKESEARIEAQMEEAHPKIDDAKSLVDECSNRNLKVLADIEAAEKDLTQYLESQSQQKDNLEKKRQKVEKYREILKKYQAKHDEVLSERDSALLKARKLTYRLKLREKISQEVEGDKLSQEEMQAEPTDEELEEIEPMEMQHEPQYYEIRMKKCKKKLQAEREKRKLVKEDPTEAYDKYMRAKDEIATSTKQVEEVEGQIAELQRDIHDRKRRWKQFRSHLSHTTNMKFAEMLSLNNYSGELAFDHKTNSLDLSVQKNSANSKGGSKDVKSLSGGERSFTTMCLLVALGETLETPFRILDEFDVFLDTEARKLTIKALIHIGKKMGHRQFIFITPQDLSSIDPDDKLKILKLKAPERHQNAGELSQQTLNFAS